jgi:hypothetical protein
MLLTAQFGQPWLLWFIAVFAERSKLSPRPSCHFLSHVTGACWKGTSRGVIFFTLEMYSGIASISSYINRDVEYFWITESNDLRKSILFCSGTVQLQSRPGWLGAAFHTTSIPTCTCWEGPASTVPHRILKHLVSRCVSIPFGRCKLLPVLLSQSSSGRDQDDFPSANPVLGHFQGISDLGYQLRTLKNSKDTAVS